MREGSSLGTDSTPLWLLFPISVVANCVYFTTEIYRCLLEDGTLAFREHVTLSGLEMPAELRSAVALRAGKRFQAS